MRITRGFSFPDPALLDALDRAAAEQRMNRSDYMRRLLEEATGFRSEHVPNRRSQPTE